MSKFPNSLPLYPILDGCKDATFEASFLLCCEQVETIVEFFKDHKTFFVTDMRGDKVNLKFIDEPTYKPHHGEFTMVYLNLGVIENE